MSTYREDLHTGHKVPLVENDDIRNGSITTDKLADGVITGDKLDPDMVIPVEKLADNSIPGSKLEDGTIPVERIADGSITGDKIADKAVTRGKISDDAVTELNGLYEEMRTELEEELEQTHNEDFAIIHDTMNAQNEFLRSSVEQQDERINELGEDLEECRADVVGYIDTSVSNLREEVYNKDDVYRKDETYSRTEIDEKENEIKSLIAEDDVQFENVEDFDSLPDPTTVSKGSIYRVANWDGTQTDNTKYCDYASDGTDWVLLAVRDYGVDDEPTEDSSNLVKSGGIASMYGIYEDNPEYVKVETDDDSKIINAIKDDGTNYFPKAEIGELSGKAKEDIISEIDSSLQEAKEYSDDADLAIKNEIEEENILYHDYYNVSKHHGVPEEFNIFTLNSDGWEQIEYNSSYPSYDELDIYNIDEVCNYLDDTEHSYKSLLRQRGYAPATVTTGYRTRVKFTLEEALEQIPEDIMSTFAPGQVITFINNNGCTEVWALKEGSSWELQNPFEEPSPEWLSVETDAEGKILSGTRVDGSHYSYNIESETIDEINKKIDEKAFENFENIEDIEGRIEITKDPDDRIVSYRKPDGTLVENAGIETSHLELTEQGMSDFQQALKDAGFNPGGGGDYSDTITEKGKKPVFIPMPRLARVNIIWDGNLSTLSKADTGGTQKVDYDVKVPVEFFDGQGVYFKKYALMSAQGNSSMAFEKKNISLKFFDTENVENNKGKWGKGDTFGTVFGDWVMQKTYHLKAFHTDFIRGSSEVAYQLADEIYKTRGIYADRPWKKALIDFSKITSSTPANLSEDGINDMNLQIDNGARCMPDGFPVIVYQNGEFYGIYVWMLKKDADNFNMDTSEAKHIHIDGGLRVDDIWGGVINWTSFEVRNPEDLICMDGSDYNGDFPAELIDNTSEYYDSTDKDHVRSAQVKQYIINLSHRIGEINAITPSYTRPDEVVITLNNYKGVYDINGSYQRGNYVLDQQEGTHYYMSLHSNNTGHALSDTDYWYDVTNEVNAVKTEIEKYFDIDNLVDYQLINMACGDTDGFGKNWQWTTWDGVKWYVNQYDKDMAFGNYWTGMFTTAPKVGWINGNMNLPCGIAIRYYQAEHIARWQELVNAGIINVEHIKGMITAWISRIGKENFVQEWKKWPEAPCNRDSKIDFAYWKFTGNSINNTPTSGNFWDDETLYSVGDKVWFKAFDGDWYLKFEAVEEGSNHPCLKGSYAVYPKSMGYRDSAWRFYKYIEETISSQNIFINSL